MTYIKAEEWQATIEELAALRAELEQARADLAAQVYDGNSIGFIHDKMKCYQTQVGTMAEMLRIMGVDYSECGNDNAERHTEGLKRAKELRRHVEVLETELTKSQQRAQQEGG